MGNFGQPARNHQATQDTTQESCITKRLTRRLASTGLEVETLLAAYRSTHSLFALLIRRNTYAIVESKGQHE